MADPTHAAMISHVCTRYGDGSLPFRKLCPACQEIAPARARDPKHAASGLDAKRSVNDGLRRDFPLLWEKAEQHDFAERLGGATSPLLAGIDAAPREPYSARF